MSKSPAALPNLLTHTVHPKVNVDSVSSEEARQILTPFFPSGVVTKMRVEERRRELAKLFQDPVRMRSLLDELPEPQRQILAICKRYGGAITGTLLLAEVTARGLIEPEREERLSFYEQQKNDPIIRLHRRMLLISWQGESLGERYYSYYGRRHYPDAALHPALLDTVEPAPPLPWPTPPTATPASMQLRSTAEVAFDLWTVAQALHDSGSWKTNKGGSLPKAMQNRVRKALAPPGDNPLTPPDVESLVYELLRGLDAVDIDDGQGRLDPAAVQRHLDRPGVQQSWRLVQAWMQIVLWQDGIGVVPGRDSFEESVRIQPRMLADAKELIVWALQRVAHGQNDWLDLAAFLDDFWEPVGDNIDFYWYNFSWQPTLKARRKNLANEVQTRKRHYWLEQEGVWVANAILGTLAHLGLVERGDVDRRPCFRLTPLGQAVFAAPTPTPLPETSPQFLTVQPNHEIVAYLNNADAAAIWPLARMARRDSTTSGLVQTFTLTRDSVYQALESGLMLEEMQRFLREHSTSGLPANVAVSLAEWSRKREALTLRSGVALLVAPAEPAVLLAKSALAGKKPAVVVDHHRAPAVCWRVEEEGRVHLQKNADAVALARLSQFADADADGWRITAASVRRAREHGLRAEQILAWIEQHAGQATPPLLETMIRNWTDGGGVFLGELLLLQVPQEQACTVLREQRRFQSFFLAQLPPHWFIVRPEKRAELERLLEEMGFATTVAWKPASPKKVEPEKPPRSRRKRRR
jgi:Helicase conserved C-terminal domain